MTGVAVGARTALAELPVRRLEATDALSIIDKLVPTSALAAEARTVVAEQTTALKTVSGSSQTYATASPARVPVGQYWENRFCNVTGSVNEQPRNTPVTALEEVVAPIAARVTNPRDRTT